MAAIGALEKSDSTFRIIHDATHGVRVNPRIRPRDQVRYPGIPPPPKKKEDPGEGGEALSISPRREGGCVQSASQSQVSRCDHGHMACQTRPERVWLNQVGTCGLGSAGYWWSRLGGAVSRLALSLMGQHEVWLVLFADNVDVLAR
eukprot:4301880-Karenia_brevis.AAC.1